MNFKQWFNVFLVISEAWQGYDSKAYGVLNHNLKLQCKKFSRTRDIPNFPTQGWAGTALHFACVSKVRHMSHFSYACKMRYLLNLVLENWEYLWSYLTFCIVILDYGLRHMSHFSYTCKMRYPLNLVLENWEYLWSYLTFCIVILDYGLKLHKLLIHTLVILQKWLEIY